MSLEQLTYDDAVFPLVHDRTYREHFLHGETARLELAPQALARVCRLDTCDILTRRDRDL